MIAPDQQERTPELTHSRLENEADLRRTLEAGSARAAQIEQTTREGVDRFGRTQGVIATSIIALFVVMVVVLTAAYLLAPFSAAADRITAGADKARELANTLLLPIVTLVLGYYFGKRSG